MTRKMLLLLLLVFFVTQVHATSDDVVEVTLAYQLENLEKLSSIQFHSTLSILFSEEGLRLLDAPRLQMDERKVEMDFTWKSSKYRSDVSLLDWATDDPMSMSACYDGNLYQHFDPESKMLSVSGNLHTANPYNNLNPLCAVYAFAYRPGDMIDIDTLQKKDTWSRLIQASKLLPSVNVNGHDCIVLTIKTPIHGQEFTQEVFFAQDLEYLPIWAKMKRENGTLKCEYKVNKAVPVGQKGEEVIVPINAEIVEYLPNGDVWQTVVLNIDETTLKVNKDEELGDELFTIAISEANYYHDIDAGVSVSVGDVRSLP